MIYSWCWKKRFVHSFVDIHIRTVAPTFLRWCLCYSVQAGRQASRHEGKKGRREEGKKGRREEGKKERRHLSAFSFSARQSLDGNQAGWLAIRLQSLRHHTSELFPWWPSAKHNSQYIRTECSSVVQDHWPTRKENVTCFLVSASFTCQWASHRGSWESNHTIAMWGHCQRRRWVFLIHAVSFFSTRIDTSVISSCLPAIVNCFS